MIGFICGSLLGSFVTVVIMCILFISKENASREGVNPSEND